VFRDDQLLDIDLSTAPAVRLTLGRIEHRTAPWAPRPVARAQARQVRPGLLLELRIIEGRPLAMLREEPLGALGLRVIQQHHLVHAVPCRAHDAAVAESARHPCMNAV
jgi:hypothetical protein